MHACEPDTSHAMPLRQSNQNWETRKGHICQVPGIPGMVPSGSQQIADHVQAHPAGYALLVPRGDAITASYRDKMYTLQKD